MNRRHLLDIATILILFILLATTSQFAIINHSGSRILSAVRVGSYMVLIMSGFLLVRACWAKHTGQDKPVKHDRMSLCNILTHAYLMGAFIFVSMYCLLGESRDATKTFFISLSIISVEDVFVHTADKQIRRSILFLIAILCAVSAGTIQGPTEFVQAFSEQRWFAIVFGWILPCVVPIFFTLIRKRRYYSSVTVREFLHFGMPFAAMLACLSLVSIDLVRHNYENATAPQILHAHRRSLANATHKMPPANHTHPPKKQHATHPYANFSLANASASREIPPAQVAVTRLVSAPDVAIPLLSLLMLPMICTVIDKCLLYNTVDIVCAATVVWAFKTLEENSGLPSALTVVSFVSASVGFFFRIYICSTDENDYSGVAYTKEVLEEEEEEQMMRSLQADLHAHTISA